eukprot:9169672-Lingulodinium_polyedra.AAC.1
MGGQQHRADHTIHRCNSIVVRVARPQLPVNGVVDADVLQGVHGDVLEEVQDQILLAPLVRILPFGLCRRR